MHLPSNVKKIPKLLEIVKYRNFKLGWNIHLRKNIYTDLISTNPNPENVGVLIHENPQNKLTKLWNEA